jgi:hypothetical protein
MPICAVDNTRVVNVGIQAEWVDAFGPQMSGDLNWFGNCRRDGFLRSSPKLIRHENEEVETAHSRLKRLRAFR